MDAQKPPYSKTFANATGYSEVVAVHGDHPVSLSGMTAGDVIDLERSTDAGRTWQITSLPSLAPASFSADIDFNIYEPGCAHYRFNKSASAGATAVARIGRVVS
jgi:hypothetical protein